MSHLKTEYQLARTLLYNKNPIPGVPPRDSLNFVFWPFASGTLTSPLGLSSSLSSRHFACVTQRNDAVCSCLRRSSYRPNRITSLPEIVGKRSVGLSYATSVDDKQALSLSGSATLWDRDGFGGFLSPTKVGRAKAPGFSLQARTYSTKSNDPETEVKGVVFHIPHPVEWVKNLWYQLIVQGWLDKSFSQTDFLFGAKQAVCHLTRLAVLQDFDEMKTVASTEVVANMKQIVSSLSQDELQSIEILPENINLAKCSFSSVRQEGEAGFSVLIDVFCLAIRIFEARPLLIQTIVRFSRKYEPERSGDWHLASIQEFYIRELGAKKEEDRSRPK